jgi:hypothetical protein
LNRLKVRKRLAGLPTPQAGAAAFAVPRSAGPVGSMDHLAHAVSFHHRPIKNTTSKAYVGFIA